MSKRSCLCPKGYGWVDFGDGLCPVSNCNSCGICLKSQAVPVKDGFIKKMKEQAEAKE